MQRLHTSGDPPYARCGALSVRWHTWLDSARYAAGQVFQWGKSILSALPHRRSLLGGVSLASSIPTYATDSEDLMDNTHQTQSKPQGNPGKGNGENAPVERVADGAHETVDKIADATHQAADAIGEKGAQLQDLQEEWLENAREYIHKNPVQSVGIAIAGGFLLSRLLSGR